MDAIELLKKDHEEVTKLFQRFSEGRGRDADAVLTKICDELDVHSQIEEEIFYPAVRHADSQLADQVDEALREHSRVKEQVRVLRRELREGGGTDRADLEGQVSALQQDVEHYVTEEESEMFPRVGESIGERERAELGQRLRDRKQQLTRKEEKPRRRRATRRSSARRATGRERRGKATAARGKARARRGRGTSRRTTGVRRRKRGRARSAKS
jgi:iron-sulfur cluster repair protein YtfE (RIC family)